MDAYSLRLISLLVSVVMILTGSSVVFIYRNEKSNIEANGKTLAVSKSSEVRGKGEDTIQAKVLLGEMIYYKSDLYKYHKKISRELALAKSERQKECGTFVKFSAIDCDICILFVNGLKALVELNSTQEDVVVFTTKTCQYLEIEDERVCAAITKEFKDELFGVATKLVLSPKEVCGLLIGSGCGEPYNPFSMWNVTLPDKPKPPVTPPTPPAPGSPRLRVLHITDIHMDPEYAVGSNAECGEPLCCRKDDGPPAPGHDGAGKYGDYRGCDSVRTTVENLFQHLKSIQDQFDYVIFTGDLPPHNVWNQSRTDQITALQTYTDLIKKYLPNKMVYNTLGNHESAPVNSFPPPYVTGRESESWMYNAVAKSWANWLPPETRDTILRGGFYTHSPFPGLRVISLNMNFCNTGNWWLLINTTDPAGQLRWLISQLQDAEDKGDKVHIIGHISPGSGSCLRPFSWNYYKIINRHLKPVEKGGNDARIKNTSVISRHLQYQDYKLPDENCTLGFKDIYENTVVGQFFGHAHSSFYEVFYDDVTFSRPVSVVFIPGSVTTYSDLNPGFRIYELDGNYTGSSWRVQDYVNYFLNLTDANQSGNLNWQLEYRAKSEYGLQNLFPSDWNQLIYRMKDDDFLFQKYLKHYSKSAPHEDCSGDCKRNKLCELKTGRNGDPDLCKDL